MSYKTKINDNIQNVDLATLKKIFTNLDVAGLKKGTFGTIATPSELSGTSSSNLTNASNNVTVRVGDTDYTIKNTNATFRPLKVGADTAYQYNVYDIIAVAKAAQISNTDIGIALDAAEVTPPKGYDNWTSTAVKSFNVGTTQATQQLQDYINKYYPGTDAYVSVIANKNGNGYTTRIVYTDSRTGAKVYKTVDVGADKLSDSAISDLLGPDSDIGGNLTNASLNGTAATNTVTNSEAMLNIVDTLRTGLSGNVGTNVNAQRSYTQEDIDAIEAAMPSTEDLKAWNQGKDVDIFKTLTENLKKSNPELLNRMSFEELQGLAGAVSASQSNIIQRNIKNQTDSTLQNIQRDPALYEAVVNQLRKDGATGTIAGQRAANAQAITSEAGVTYDKAATDLYSALFGGEQGGAAAKEYDTTMKSRTGALNQYVTGQLGAADAAAKREAIDVQNLDMFLTALAEAGKVDAAKYQNKVAEGQIDAKGAREHLKSEVEKDLRTQIAQADADLRTRTGLFDKATEYWANATNNGTDISSTLYALFGGEKAAELAETAAGSPEFKEALLTAFNKSNGGGATLVTPHEYQYTDLLDNTQYNNIVNNAYIQGLLDLDTIKAYTTGKTSKDLTSQFGLLTADGIDMLDSEGLKTLYTQYNDEATGKSNKVFNQAQRAYIAAITAGDSKTAEQLTRLATSTGTSKGNLYATAALANQFKQQTGLNTTGRQLATDFLNQRDTNTSNANSALIEADNAWKNYQHGDPNNTNSLSVDNILNQFKQNTSAAGSAYGKFGNSMMQTTQSINDSRVSNNINNRDAVLDYIKTLNTANITAGANNITNQGTKNVYQSYLDAVAETAKSNLKK